MKRTVEINGKKVLELVRYNTVWTCTECKKDYTMLPNQCTCGAMDRTFTERQEELKDSVRKMYKVFENIIYDGDQINAGSLVSMVEKDRVTKNLVERKLIEEVVTSKPVKDKEVIENKTESILGVK